MKKIIAFISLVSFFASCAPSNLYYWGKYDQATYQFNKTQTEESRVKLLSTYEDIIKNKAKSLSKEVPPGIYADYGYLLIQDGQIAKGKEMLEKELSIYPESKKMVEYILKKL